MEEEKVVLAKVAWSHILSNILASFFVNRWRGSGKSTHPPMPRQHLIGRNWCQSGGMSGCHEVIGHIILSICRSLLHWIDLKPFLLNSLHSDWLNDWCFVLGNKHDQLSTPVRESLPIQKCIQSAGPRCFTLFCAVVISYLVVHSFYNDSLNFCVW